MKNIKLIRCVLFGCLLLSKTYKATAQHIIVADSSNVKIIVSSRIENSVDSLMNALYHASVKDFAVNYVYENDSLVSLTKETGQKFANTMALDAFCTGDTLTLLINPGFDYAGVVEFTIANGAYYPVYTAFTSGAKIFKPTSGSAYGADINVTAVAGKLVLNKLPSCKKGEEIDGEFDGEFAAFYKRTGDTDKTIKVKWRTLFKTVVGANEPTKIEVLKP